MIKEITKRKIDHPDFSKNVGFAVDAVKYLAVHQNGGLSIDLNFIPLNSFPQEIFDADLATLGEENFFFSAKSNEGNLSSLIKSFDEVAEDAEEVTKTKKCHLHNHISGYESLMLEALYCNFSDVVEAII